MSAYLHEVDGEEGVAEGALLAQARAHALVVELAEAAHDAVGDVGAVGEEGLPALGADHAARVEVHEVYLRGKKWWRLSRVWKHTEQKVDGESIQSVCR